MILANWAKKWGVSHAALCELQEIFSLHNSDINIRNSDVKTEAELQALVRLHASKNGFRVWRNNVGAVHTSDDRFIRFGLANESEKMNKMIKSADLIGIKPILIEKNHMGITIGQFVSYEVKAPQRSHTNKQRLDAQIAWRNLILAFGGDARIIRSVEDI